MIEQDTIKLLRECDAGVKMGVDSIKEVLPYVHSQSMRDSLRECKNEHEELEKELRGLLRKYGDEGKDPSLMAKGMSHMKTKMKLTVNHSDSTIANLMSDGCHMGVKSLCRYLNQYKAADEVSKDITKRLINQEEELAAKIRGFL